jgi:Carboxypeptidase regulatory-like domain
MSARHPASVRNEDGAFEIRGIAPGVYTLIANRGGREQGRATASHQITVGSRDLDGIVLTLALPLEITGTVQPEGDIPLNLGAVRVFLEPATVVPMFGGTAPATVTNGTFKLAGVSPGHYRVRATNLPDGAYVKSVRQGPQEVLESGLQLSGASMPIEIVLGTKAPVITGTVLDSSGKPAANIAASLVPDGPRRSRYELYATATTADTGTFTFRNIAPGDYKIFLLAENEVEGLQNPAFLGQIEARGTSVRLSEGKTENLQLSVK